MGPVTSAPIDDFLAGAGSASAAGERLETIGAGLGLGGTVLAVGLIVFLAVVHRGRRSEVGFLLRLTMLAGVLMLVGGAVEIAGTAAVLDIGWAEALTDGDASAAMMRLLAGLLVVLGFVEETVPVGGLAGEPDAVGPDEAVAWVPGSASAFGLAGVALGVFSFAFDGHTVTEGPRLVHAVVNTVHVAAGGAWFGGIVALVLVSIVRRRSGGAPLGPLVVRFSPVATGALVAVASAGLVMTWMIADGWGDLTGTPWGRRLLIKNAAVAAAAIAGAINHFVLVPRLRDGDETAERSTRTTLAVEAVLLTLVVVATIFLVGSSTN